MSEDKDLEQLKKEAAAAAKAKAAERTKKKAQEGASDDIAKQKAAAAAKAKAAALAKKKAQEGASDDEAKQKAVAAAKAKATALARKKAQEGSGNDADKAKAAAAAKAKAMAAAKAKMKRAGDTGSSEKEEEKPSPNQPLLDRYVAIIKEQLGSDVIEEAYINRLSKDVPTLVIQNEAYYKVAQCFKTHDELYFEYLSELHGTDYETHMEVYVHLYSYKHQQPVALKVKIDRDQPEIDSLVPLWQGANWPECEAYDLLGIVFKGHPNLYRIMLGEDWVGYPLRKDYEPYDEEV